jgi:hypothetical protein
LSSYRGIVAKRLQVDRPAEFGEFFLDVGECVGQCGAPVRAGSALGKDALALEHEVLALSRALGLTRMGDGRVLSGCSGLRFLLFYGFAFRSM